MADRSQLEAWIAKSQRTQTKLKLALIPGVIGAFVVMMWSRPLGGLVLVSDAIVAIFGFWITSSHVVGWNNDIRRLDAPPPERTKDGRLRRQRD